LLLEQEGAAMISAGLSTREDGGHLIVTLRGDLHRNRIARQGGSGT
jgi:hypothetical protein